MRKKDSIRGEVQSTLHNHPKGWEGLLVVFEGIDDPALLVAA